VAAIDGDVDSVAREQKHAVTGRGVLHGASDGLKGTPQLYCLLPQMLDLEEFSTRRLPSPLASV
jgi:hypothetical protein